MHQDAISPSARRLAVAALNLHERERGFVLSAQMVDEPRATAAALVQLGCFVTSDGRGGLVVGCPRKRTARD